MEGNGACVRVYCTQKLTGANFEPTMPMIFSGGAEDHLVKIVEKYLEFIISNCIFLFAIFKRFLRTYVVNRPNDN